MKTTFPIATSQGVRHVEGFKPSEDSLIGINRPDSESPWNVTFLPTGTTCNSVFPERFGLGQKAMLAYIATIEEEALAAWLGISGLPWGCTEAPDWAEPLMAEIRRVAGV